MRYTYNEKEQKIEEEEIGRFVQFPIRLAWAITVHKSQGLTFQHVKIDLSGGASSPEARPMWPSQDVSRSKASASGAHPPQRHLRQEARCSSSRTPTTTGSSSTRLSTSSMADKEYHDAVEAFDDGDAEAFSHPFLQSHPPPLRHQAPVVRRFIRLKLNQLFEQREENRLLRIEAKRRRIGPSFP